MLVLSRRVGEGVCVGPGVTIRVIETRGNRVRLAIDAPADVRVTRSELTSAHSALGAQLFDPLPLKRSKVVSVSEPYIHRFGDSFAAPHRVGECNRSE